MAGLLISRTCQVVGRQQCIGRRLLSVSTVKASIFHIQDEEDFDKRVLKSDKPVLVDFHAKWCGPCKQLTPRLETVAQQHEDRLDLAKVDIDEHDDLAAQYQVSAVPVVFALKDGKVVDKFIGLQDADKISTFVMNLLDK